MKVVILCGGQGTRIREVADNIPKPMIVLCGYPLLWHIMRHYANYGHSDFVLCLGYKGDIIKNFFLNYTEFVSDFTISLGKKKIIEYHGNQNESGWRVTLAETGVDSLTGTRVKYIRRYVESERDFMLTYGDGLSNINLDQLVEFHHTHGKVMTITGVHPPGRFGELDIDSSCRAIEFNEKPQTTEGWISGGYFVCKQKIFDYFDSEKNEMLEEKPMSNLVQTGEMMVYRHNGFWQCMDTPRDYRLLVSMCQAQNLPWQKQ